MKYTKFKNILHEHARLPIEIDRDSFHDVLDGYETIETKPRFTLNRKVIGFVMSMMLFIAVSTTFLIFEFTPSKTLTIDLNPGFELILNRFNRVVNVNAVGDDASTMIDDLHYWHQSPEKVLSSIVDVSIEKGYATENNVTVLISVNTTDEVLLEKLTEKSDALQLKTMFMSINMNESVTYTSQLLTSPIFSSALDSYKIYIPVISESNTTDSTASNPESFYNDYYGPETTVTSSVVFTENLLTSLANYHEITLGKLQLVIAIFEAYDDYDTEAEFQVLIDSPISELVELYEERH